MWKTYGSAYVYIRVTMSRFYMVAEDRLTKDPLGWLYGQLCGAALVQGRYYRSRALMIFRL